MAGKSPTECTLDFFRKLDWPVAKSEYWQPSFAVGDLAKAAASGTAEELAAAKAKYRSAGPGVRKDLFGFCDVVALSGSQFGIIAVQATSDSNVAARVAKIAAECGAQAEAWLRSGGSIWVMGWKKKGVRWTPRVMEIRLPSSASTGSAKLTSSLRDVSQLAAPPASPSELPLFPSRA